MSILFPSPFVQRWIALFALAVFPAATVAEVVPAATQPVVPIDHGLRVFVAGHSFHVPMAPVLAEVAKSAGLADNELLGTMYRGGSQVKELWDVPTWRNPAKTALRSGKVDVLTTSPLVQLPDPGLDQFVELALQNNPAARVTVQLSWPAYDAIFDKRILHRKVDRAATDLVALDKAGEGYRKAFAEQIAAANQRAGKPVAFSVPIGPAVLAFREKVRLGQAPGVKSEAELFSDALGHPREAIMVLNAYCHFAVIYRRTPVGLPVPSTLARMKRLSADDRVALNQLLQTLAWDAVRRDPHSGLTVAP